MGGGPSQQQKNAANAQAQLEQQMSSNANQQQQFLSGVQGQVSPFFSNQMQNGLPYYNNLVDQAGGTTAQAFAPAKAQLEQQLGQSPNALPSGFAQQARTDLATQQAKAYDQSLVGAQQQQYGARQQGAAGLMGAAGLNNASQLYGSASGANQSIMNAPLASPGLGGLLGGLAGGLASAIPF